MKTALNILAGVFLLMTAEVLYAQGNGLTFPAGELREVSLRYSGNTLNWPVVISLAEHNIPNNTFTLSSSDILQLQNFSKTSAEVASQRERTGQLISSGATIFAPNELREVNDILSSFKKAIDGGDIEEAFEYGNRLKPAVDELEQTLMANRLVDVQAQLSRKDGDVDKRKGLLGSWNEAFKGDLFKESDGIKTHVKSYANLSFTDGSNILVNPSTVAVIRKSRIDKLDESSDTEISLEDGGLLAKLSAAGKEKSRYILNAGPSQSELKTQNFYAEAEGEERVKLTNYDGEAIVNANEVTLSIKKNEGTIVERGQDPLPPVKLLPAPSAAWASSDTVIYRTDILYSFKAVENAASYHIQYSTSSDFDNQVVDINTTQTAVSLDELPLGITYVRVQATDSLGLRGPYSEAVRIIRNIDNKPPPLFVDGSKNDILFTQNNSLTVSGVTEPNARLEIDGESIPVNASGKFSYTKTGLKNDQLLQLSAADGSGNKTEKPLRVIKLTEDVLFDFKLRNAEGRDPITVNASTFTISGTAYPGLEVIITNGTENKIVRTDSRGRWGITMSPKASEISLSFKSSLSGTIYSTKSYTVEVKR